MEWLRNNFELVVLILLIVLVALGVTAVIFSYLFNRNFINKKIKLHCFLEINSDTGEKIYSFSVVNRGLNDTVITALGFNYGSKSIDFFEACDYLKATKDSKVVVPQRDSIKVTINPDKLEELVLKINTFKKIKMIKCYVVDSVGTMTTARVKDAYKAIKSTHDAIVEAQNESLKRTKLEEKRQAKSLKMEQDRVKAYMNAKEKRIRALLKKEDLKEAQTKKALEKAKAKEEKALQQEKLKEIKALELKKASEEKIKQEEKLDSNEETLNKLSSEEKNPERVIDSKKVEEEAKDNASSEKKDKEEQ